jgi:hypothetical protein
MLPTKIRFICPSGFREKIFFKSANQKQELSVATMFVNGSGRNEQSLYRTFHRCFLLNFRSIGFAVSEENIKMWKVNGQRTTDDGRRTPSDGKTSHCLWHKNRQSRETGNIGYTERRKTQHNMWWTPLYTNEHK